MSQPITVQFPQLIEAFEFIKGEYVYARLPGRSTKTNKRSGPKVIITTAAATAHDPKTSASLGSSTSTTPSSC